LNTELFLENRLAFWGLSLFERYTAILLKKVSTSFQCTLHLARKSWYLQYKVWSGIWINWTFYGGWIWLNSLWNSVLKRNSSFAKHCRPKKCFMKLTQGERGRHWSHCSIYFWNNTIIITTLFLCGPTIYLLHLRSCQSSSTFCRTSHWSKWNCKTTTNIPICEGLSLCMPVRWDIKLQ